MADKNLKELFAELWALAYNAAYPDAPEKFTTERLLDLLEKPKNPKMGRVALPAFRFATELKEKPPDIARKVSDEANKIGVSDSRFSALGTVAAGPFINGTVDFLSTAKQTLESVLSKKSAYGASDNGKGKTVLVEYCSCNIAKPFGIAHLRTTILGNSLRRIFKKLGYDVVGINYIGDWGTQFGKMIVAYRMWGEGLDLSKNAVEQLFSLYVRFHTEAELNESLNDDARRAFKALETGDPEATKLWQQFSDISMEEFERVFEMLGVEFDKIMGESFFNDSMDAVIDRIERAGLTKVSQGALVVEMDDPNLPPCLLRKADGATLYATRDLAGLIWRWETYRFHESLYVVASSQSDHFRQVFSVIRKLEEAERLPESERMSGKVKHTDFGWVRFGEKTMSTRRGDVIFLQDVVSEAVRIVREKIVEKNPNLPEIDKTAHDVGAGAVIFSQYSARRLKDISFNWKDVLSFEGETGPYLQYTHARLCSLVRNYGKPISDDFDLALLENEEEERVIEMLADFPQAIEDSARNYDPYYVAVCLLKLAGAFNKVYQRKDEKGRIDRIISDNDELTAARIALVQAVQIVINEGLDLLGLKAPQEM